jgi:hypothetical protein
MHYGVTFQEKEFTGNGTLLLKKALQAGKCDQVPKHILELQERLHAEFLDRCSLAELSYHPDWTMEKYFLTSGRPDHTKTTTVVGIPLPLHSRYRLQNLINTASKVPELHHQKADGPQTLMIFMGWDAEAVDEAAKGHPAKDAKDMEEKARERERAREKLQEDRDKMHVEYLKRLTRQKCETKARINASPVGSYVVDCAAFDDYFADERAYDLSLDIHETDTPGILQIDFDFVALEGVMMICGDEEALGEYCSERAEWSDSQEEAEDDTESSESEEEVSRRGSKRKPSESNISTRTKKRKGGGIPSREYFLKMRCRELEGQIYWEPEDGSIEFDDINLVSFEGVTDFPCFGSNVSFYARKISDKPCPSRAEWADYSERQYESERVGRWR